jgi:hypothetical protein
MNKIIGKGSIVRKTFETQYDIKDIMSGYVVHVLKRVLSDSSFSQVIPLNVLFSLLRFILFSWFFDYRDKAVNTTSTSGKIGLHDAIIPAGQCISEFSPWMWIVLLVALIFWLLRLVFVIYNTSLNWEIRAFYRTALGIADVRIFLNNV